MDRAEKERERERVSSRINGSLSSATLVMDLVAKV